MATISFAITVCNEHEELNRLLSQLSDRMRKVDEVVVQYDKDRVTDEVFRVLDDYYNVISHIVSFSLNGDFSKFKNNIKSHCSKEYIFFLDADEYFSENLLTNLPHILQDNPHIDMLSVPRSNTVIGLTPDHVTSWRWRVDEFGRVNWPDYQNRIVKNNQSIVWVNKVHEVISGYSSSTNFPCETEDWCLYHPKTIERQVKQNQLYSQL
jgi:glycosyltransferase involved in cell wall biosynthesis